MSRDAKYTRMRARLEAITKFVNTLQKSTDPYTDNEWQRGHEFAQVEISKELRKLLNILPKGFNREEPSLKNQAKTRYLQWRENQAKAEWKKLPEHEQKRWEAYVENGIDFGNIREAELAREAPFAQGDKVVLHHNLSYLGTLYSAGSLAEITRVVYDEVREEKSYMLKFEDQRLDSLNAYDHEIRRA
jgi:hypothetical protein